MEVISGSEFASTLDPKFNQALAKYKKEILYEVLF